MILHSTLTTQHVIIVGDNSLFEEGITNLLTVGTGIHVSNVNYMDDPSFLDMIAQDRPDVILLNESTLLDSAHILELLFSTPSSMALHVIVIRLGNNMVDVYEMPRRYTVTKRDELIAVVRGDFQCM